MNDYDVIVIGSGIGGLMSAGLLAARGLRPLLLESHQRPGGYMTSFKRNGFIFDSAVDCISGIQPDGVIGRILSLLEIGQEPDLLRIEPIRRSIFPDFTIDVDPVIGAYIERLVSRFPAESGGITEFFKTAERIYKDVLLHIDVFGEEYGRMLGISRDTSDARRITYEAMLDRYISDPLLKAVLSDRCPFTGLPPSSISALPMIMLIMSYFQEGAYRPAGGFQGLSDLIARGIREKGGRIIFGSRVTKIIHDRRQCQGVVTEDGGEYTARYVIPAMDYIHTLSSLLGNEHLKVTRKMLAEPGVSTSFFIVYGAFRGDFRGSSSIGYFPSLDFSYLFDPGSAFKEDGTIGMTIASVEDPLRAPEGYQTIVLHEMVEGNRPVMERERSTEKLVKKAEKALPELRERIEVIDTATPATLERYTGNHQGAAFGWRQVPGNLMISSHGLENLFIAGHWSGMGGGVLAAAYSGAKAAADILSREGVSVGS